MTDVFILQKRKQMHRESKPFVQGHTAGKRQRQAPKPAGFIPEPVCALSHHTVSPLNDKINIYIYFYCFYMWNMSLWDKGLIFFFPDRKLY